MSNVLSVDRLGAVVTLTLNRPESRNALSRDLQRRLERTIGELDADPSVRAIILTGTDPAFCSGVDFRDLEDRAIAGSIGPRDAPIVTSTTPLIGAINGPAYTGGLELALACHFLVASTHATFADTHARLGVTPGWGLTVMLTEAVGSRRAREMSVASRALDATTALEWGLVNHVVAHDDLLPFTVGLAQHIASNDARAVSRVSDLYNNQRRVRDERTWVLESEAFLPLDDFTRHR